MTVVWLINISMPDACAALGHEAPVIGGWLTGYREALLSAYPDVQLHIVEPYWGAQTQTVVCDAQGQRHANEYPSPPYDQGALIHHHLFPQAWLESGHELTSPSRSSLTAASNRMVAHFAELYQEVQPDVVHLHGTELPHGLAWIEANGSDHTLVSIQGLAFEIARVYMAGLTSRQQRPSFSDWRHGYSLASDRQRLQRRGTCEQRLLSLVEHIAGRTQWDHDCALAQHPQLCYHTLQEVLRPEFYEASASWQQCQCRTHSLFVSQSYYPIKGFHRLLEALPAVISHYPDLQVRIVGHDLTNKRWWQRSTYGNVLHRLIERHDLRRHLTFLGPLTAQQMIEEYQQAQVFVCPSCIENSSNSVCEAQMIGTPVVAARVGGMATLIRHGETGLLYDYDDTATLSAHLCQLLGNADLCRHLGAQASAVACSRHDNATIAHTLYNIYREI